MKGNAVAKQPADRVSQKIGILVPTLVAMNYFFSLSLVIPVLPKVVNSVVSGAEEVTSRSASLYGTVSGIDALFTFLTVNAHGSLSDKFGRRPFMALASLGLGVGFLISSQAQNAWMLMVAAALDGCTSCMYAIANAYVVDVAAPSGRLVQALGAFQAIALGGSFMFGLPLGGVLGMKKGIRFPLYVAAALCALNVLFIALFVPEPVSKEARAEKKVSLAASNPWGAVRTLGGSPLLAGTAAAYFLVWIAHSAMQINWINFTQARFGWGVAQSGLSLCLMGLLVGVAPRLLIPVLGTRRSITSGICLLASANFLLAFAKQEWMVYVGIVLLGVGSIVFPALLGFLSDQAAEGAVGAMQGAADTVKTLTTVFAYPLASLVFGYAISEERGERKMPGLHMAMGGTLLAAAAGLVKLTLSRYGHLAQPESTGSSTELNDGQKKKKGKE